MEAAPYAMKRRRDEDGSSFSEEEEFSDDDQHTYKKHKSEGVWCVGSWDSSLSFQYIDTCISVKYCPMHTYTLGSSATVGQYIA